MAILLLKSENNRGLFVELVGILACLDIADFDFSKLTKTYDIHTLLEKHLFDSLSSENSKNVKENSSIYPDDDITLQIIIFLGTMIKDISIVPIIAKTNIPQTLVNLIISIFFNIQVKDIKNFTIDLLTILSSIEISSDKFNF